MQESTPSQWGLMMLVGAAGTLRSHEGEPGESPLSAQPQTVEQPSLLGPLGSSGPWENPLCQAEVLDPC